MSDTPAPLHPALKLRLVFGQAGMIGPGKAELLERIAASGSISEAGRQMGMSYKRAWGLVETLNALFAEPLVVRSRGGAGGGGAQVTATGRAVLRHYRAVEQAALRAGGKDIASLAALLRDPTKGDMSG